MVSRGLRGRFAGLSRPCVQPHAKPAAMETQKAKALDGRTGVLNRNATHTKHNEEKDEEYNLDLGVLSLDYLAP